MTMQVLTASGWQNLSSGYSAYVSDLGPGTYRLVVENLFQRRTEYSVRHRRGLG